MMRIHTKREREREVYYQLNLTQRLKYGTIFKMKPNKYFVYLGSRLHDESYFGPRPTFELTFHYIGTWTLVKAILRVPCAKWHLLFCGTCWHNPRRERVGHEQTENRHNWIHHLYHS